MPSPSAGVIHRSLHLQAPRLALQAGTLHRSLHLLHPREQPRVGVLHRRLHLGAVRLSHRPQITGTFHVFDDVDYTTDLGTIQHPVEAGWLDADDDVGSGYLTVQNDDSQLSLLDAGRVVQCRVEGEPAFSWVIDGNTNKKRLPAGPSGRRSSKTGKGTASILNRATVPPTVGYGLNPFSDDRVFSFTSPQFPIDSRWTDAKLILDSTSFGDLPPGFPTIAPWIGPPSGTYIQAPMGHVYFIKDFTLSADAFVTFFVGVDDRLFSAIDGIALIDLTGVGAAEGFRKPHAATMYLSAGTHRLAIDLINDFGFGFDPGPGVGPVFAGNPARLIVAAWTSTGQGQLVQHIFSTGTDWRCLEYPAAPPGMTMGRIWNVLLDEVAADGLLTTLGRDWTDTLDANGNLWDSLPSVSCKVGMDLESVVKAHRGSAYLEFRMRPDANVLRLFRWQESGVPRAANFAPDVNVAELTEIDDDTHTDCFSVRWSKGQLRYPSSGGSRMGFLSVPAASTTEARQIAEAVRVSQSLQRTQITVGPVPRGDGDVPYRDFAPADTITVDGSLERCRQIGATYDDVLGLKFGLIVRDVILDADERLSLVLKRFANGNLAGQVYAAAPALPAPQLFTHANPGDVTYTAPEIDGVPQISESADKTLAVGANLYAVKVTLKTAGSSSTAIRFLIDGTDCLAGTGVIVAGIDMVMFSLIVPGPIVYCVPHVTRLAAALDVLGTGATGILVEPLFV